MMLWHYTVGDWWELILKDEVIKLADKNVPKYERAVVWFSSSDNWEETANKSVMTPDGLHDCDREDTALIGHGLFRIGVAPEVAPYRWNDYKKLSGIKAKHANALYGVAIMRGSRPGDWYVSFDPVPKDKWLAVQKWEESAWIDHKF